MADRIIFLDIDGVLNSLRYDRIRESTQGNIDETRLPLLKEIIDKHLQKSYYRPLGVNIGIEKQSFVMKLARI